MSISKLKSVSLGLIALLLIPAATAFAGSPTFTVKPSGETLDSKVLFENVELGQVLKGSLKIQLKEDVATKFSIGFVSQQISEFEDVKGLEFSSWVRFPEGSEKIISNIGSAEIPYEIHVPPGVSPGDYNGMFLVAIDSYGENIRGIDKAEEKQIGTGAKVKLGIGIEAIVRIQGALDPNLEYQSLDGYKKDENLLALDLEIENTGNVAVKPSVKIEIYNMYGEIAYSGDHPIPLMNPKQKSKETLTMPEKNFVIGKGIYKVETELTYQTFSFVKDTDNIIMMNAGSKSVRIINLPIFLISILVLIALSGASYPIFIIVKRRKLSKNSVNYKIIKGDTLQSISEKFAASPNDIILLNKLKKPYFLSENSEILIPSKK